MSKIKSPLLSFGAVGGLGEAVTFTRRRGVDIVEKTPIPAYRRTLPQLYQRWLYEDYAYLWTQQTAATKQTYASAGTRWHLTGFQYWMKYMLTNLPDIAGMWHLDAHIGAIAYDFSRNANHGAIIGATGISGIIDGARFFDGTNDLINCGTSQTLNFRTGDFTLEAWVNLEVIDAFRRAIMAKYGAGDVYTLEFLNDDRWFFYIWTPTANIAVHGTTLPIINTWYHLIGMKVGNIGYIYVNGDFDAQSPATGPIDCNPAGDPFYIGWEAILRHFSGIIDHVVVYNRALDATEIKRHSERRYP